MAQAEAVDIAVGPLRRKIATSAQGGDIPPPAQGNAPGGAIFAQLFGMLPGGAGGFGAGAGAGAGPNAGRLAVVV